MKYTFPPKKDIPVSEQADFIREVKIYSTSTTLLPTDITTYWICNTQLTCTMFDPTLLKYNNTFHRYRIVNSGTQNLRIIASDNFWNDGISTITIKPKTAVTISGVKLDNIAPFWAVLNDVSLDYILGQGITQTIVSTPFVINLGPLVEDMSEGTITKNSTQILIGADGDYLVSGLGDVTDTGSSATKISYLNLKITRGATTISRSSLTILTRGNNATYSQIIPQQNLSLKAGDKLFMEFEPSAQLTGTLLPRELKITRVVNGVG